MNKIKIEWTHRPGTTKRAALYARVSTGEQDEGMQVREMTEEAMRRGWSAEIFPDPGVSGAKEKRPGLDRMMADVRRRKFDVVMVYKFDRFARSLRHLILALEEFNALGVEFVSVKDNVDTTTPGGRLMFQIIGAFAEFEREVIRERVKSGIAHARASGKGWGRPRALADLGEIRSRRNRGESWATIAKALGVSRDTCRRIAASQPDIVEILATQKL